MTHFVALFASLMIVGSATAEAAKKSFPEGSQDKIMAPKGKTEGLMVRIAKIKHKGDKIDLYVELFNKSDAYIKIDAGSFKLMQGTERGYVRADGGMLESLHSMAPSAKKSGNVFFKFERSLPDEESVTLTVDNAWSHPTDVDKAKSDGTKLEPVSFELKAD